MSTPLAAALLRISETNPRAMRHHSGLNQSDFGSFFGLSTASVSRSELSGEFTSWSTGAWLWLVAWTAVHGPDVIEAMQAAGRWSLVSDVRNAADAITLQCLGEADAIEATIAKALGRAR